LVDIHQNIVRFNALAAFGQETGEARAGPQLEPSRPLLPREVNRALVSADRRTWN